MGDLDAVGEAMTGAIAARTIEPAHGAIGQGHGACLNCGTGLIGAHCHRCGQAAHVHRTIGAIGHEILHGVVHFEGKLWSTLPLLALRPGELTRRYVAGERARFVSPMALFLFSIFTMFAVLSATGVSPPADLSLGKERVSVNIGKAQTTLAEQRKVAVEERARLPAGDPEAAKLTRQIGEFDKSIAALRAAGASSSDPVYIEGKTGWARIDQGIEKARKNPSLMLYKLQANSYKFSWLLIPLSLPFMWLMFFWKPQYKVYDHAVFVTYSIAFMSLFFIAIAILGSIAPNADWVGALAVLIPPLHVYRQLRGAYQLRRRSAVLRTILLSSFIIVVLLLFLSVLLGLGFLG